MFNVDFNSVYNLYGDPVPKNREWIKNFFITYQTCEIQDHHIYIDKPL